LSTTVFDFEIQALDGKGTEAISQQIVTYNGYFSELRLHDLATLKADGGVIAVDERAIRDQPASADTSSPYFDERRQRIIAYSNVAPGDEVRDLQGKKARIRWRVCVLLEPAGRPAPEVIELALDGPASKPLHVALRNVEHSEERLGDRIVHQVRFTHDAQYNLGWAYESGTGVPKDTQEAIKWYGKASDRGNAQAQARLEGLTAANSFWQILFRHIRLLDAL
jgi:hypothetical protein